MTRELLRKIFFLLLLISCLLSFSTGIYAEVLDRVVAVVDDEVIMLSELNEAYEKVLYSGMEITREKVLDSMINRILILKQVKRFNIEYFPVTQTMKNENELVSEYIERRLKSFIRIPFVDIELFYKRNKESFDNKDLYDVRDEIEAYLVEKELNKILIKHIEELRKEAYIRIQLTHEN